MKRTSYRSRTASVALTMALLTTPATTLPLLWWADQSSKTLGRVAEGHSYGGVAFVIALILIGLPAVASAMAWVALRTINSSWSPVAGGGKARGALVIGLVSTVAATAIFLRGILF